MSVSLRTALHWLREQQIHDDAECWVLADDTVEPVIGVTSDSGDTVLRTAPVWEDPSPVALHHADVYDMILEHYSGGGELKWAAQPEYMYRGSYVVNPEVAVFFAFLPEGVEILESHAERMQRRKQQAITLTREIEESQSWPTSM